MRAPSRTSPWLLAISLAGLPLLSAACGSDFSVKVAEAWLDADPGFVDFGVLPVGADGDATVTLTAANGAVTVLAMEVLNVEGNWIDVDNSSLPVIESGASVQVPVSYSPLAAGRHWGELKIVTDEQENDEHVVAVRGEALDNLVRAYPSVIDYGPVRPGESGEHSVTLVNEGLTDLTISSAESDHGSFTSTSAFPVALPAGQRAAIQIVFSPTDDSAANAALVVGFAEFTGLDPVTLRGNDCSTAAGDLYDVDGDGHGWCGGDCDDWDENSHPGGVEECNGADNDCDGTIDEDTSCSDDDGDGYAEVDGDCNDGDGDIGQHAEEIWGNGIDDDCDGVVDDGTVDGDGDGYSVDGGDCDDADADVHPGADEEPDGVDDDCDGTADEGTTRYDDDGDGYSEWEGDCNDSDAAVGPAATEIGNWLDDDCDGLVDEGTTYGDDDGDGFSEVGGDCDDADEDSNPGEPEILGDGIDNDCDGVAE